MHEVSSTFLSDTEVESVYAEIMALSTLQYIDIYTSQTQWEKTHVPPFDREQTSISNHCFMNYEWLLYVLAAT